MLNMFAGVGLSASTWSIGDLSDWDVSSVTNMSSMFYSAGIGATIWDIGDISRWDVSNVTEMFRMFERAGYSATYNLDLSSWNVGLVTSYGDFNNGVTDKITPPVWNASS